VNYFLSTCVDVVQYSSITTYNYISLSGKVLVFAHHRAVLDEVVTYLSGRGVDHVRIDGMVSSRERYLRVNRFQETPSCRVAVLGITSAGVAISLTAASTVFFVELFCTLILNIYSTFTLLVYSLFY
jgi:SNF2 family DNA or RNA helicase